MIELFNDDCMAVIANYPDKYFGLAVVDPPYGNFNGTIERNGGSWAKKYQIDNNIKHWDVAPSEEYFKELFRVSKHQIIWGGNYFSLPPSKHFIIWEKISISESFTMAMAEYAWSSINDNAKIFKHRPQREDGTHPTQKPVALYKWILSKYAKDGDKILDTHGGSMSSVIACIDGGFDMVCSELDKDYFDAAVNRINKHVRQMDMFNERPEIIIHEPPKVLQA